MPWHRSSGCTFGVLPVLVPTMTLNFLRWLVTAQAGRTSNFISPGRAGSRRRGGSTSRPRDQETTNRYNESEDCNPLVQLFWRLSFALLLEPARLAKLDR